MGPGGGLVGSGESASTWRLHDYILIQLEEFDKWVAQAKGKTIPSNPRFNLGIAREGNTLGLAVVEMSLNRLIWSREMSLD